MSSSTTIGDYPVLFEDRHLVVVHKPAGVPVAPTRQGDGSVATHTGLSPCHRLDLETSGCLVLARTATGHRAISLAFAEGRVLKTYLAVVLGPAGPLPDTGESAVLLGEWQRGRVQIGRGRPASTRWRVRWRGPTTAGLEVTPSTGRTHQIRAHLSDKGLPIVGDPTYGGPAAARLMLHAWRVELPWPSAGAPTRIEAPPPPGFLDAGPADDSRP